MFKNKDKPTPPQPSPGPKGAGQTGESQAGAGEREPMIQPPLGSEQAAADVQALTSELDEVNNKWKRALADFQNYQRRAIENEREARRQGITAVLSSIIPVLDHFELALEHDASASSAQQVIDGVKVIREELLKALGSHGVGLINPAPDEELDPNRHQVITHLAAQGVEPGHVSATLQVGYLLGERVLRPAKVAVAPPAAD